MSEAVGSSLGIVAYLALFASVGVLFLFANLLIGWLVRPSDPHAEKREIYECGEPTIGSSFVQFDLRFYVVALLFIIFDVEVAFFFPWATVFGKSMNTADPRFEVVQYSAENNLELTPDAESMYRELGVRNPQVITEVPSSLQGVISPAAGEKERATAIVKESSKQLAWVTIVDIAVFFAVLLVGFAYVWKRGDLDWVRAVSRERSARSGPGPSPPANIQEPALSA